MGLDVQTSCIKWPMAFFMFRTKGVHSGHLRKKQAVVGIRLAKTLAGVLYV